MQVMFLNRLYFNWVDGSCLQLCWYLRHLWLNSAFVFWQKVKNRFLSILPFLFVKPCYVLFLPFSFIALNAF